MDKKVKSFVSWVAIALFLVMLILANLFGATSAQETRKFWLDPQPAFSYAEYSITAGNRLEIPLNLKFNEVGSPKLQSYSTPMGSWMALDTASLSVIRGSTSPFTLSVNTPSNAYNGEYGIILQGVWNNALEWRWKIFVTVSGGQTSTSQENQKTYHAGASWIIADNMARTIYLPKKTGFDMTIWVKSPEAEARDILVDWNLVNPAGQVIDLETGHNIWANPNDERSFTANVDLQALYDGGAYTMKFWARDRGTGAQLEYVEVPLTMHCPPFGSLASADEELSFSVSSPTTTTTTSTTTSTSTSTSTATSTITSTSTSTSTTTSTSTATYTSTSTSTSTHTTTATQTTATRLPTVTRPSFVFLTPVGSIRTNGTFQISGYIAQFDYTYLPSIFVNATIQVNGGAEIPILVSKNLEYPIFWTVDEDTGRRSGTKANGGAYAFSVTVSGLSPNSLPWIPHIVTLRLYDTYIQLGYPPSAFPIFVYVVR